MFDSILSPIYSAMGWILNQIYTILGAIWAPLGNYAIAIVVFTIIIKAALIFTNINQQRTTAKQVAVRPKLEKLKEQCGDDRQLYQQKMQELYKKEGVKMMGGCLPQLITLPFLWGVWMAIRSPLSYMAHIGSDVVASAKDYVAAAKEVEAAKLTELDVIHNIDIVKANNGDGIFNSLIEWVQGMLDQGAFNLFGIDLTQTPQFTLDFSKLGVGEGAEVNVLLWIIPLLSFATSLISVLITTKIQKKSNPDAQQGNTGCMMLIVPIMSLYISFIVPGAVGFYWMCSNILTTIIQLILAKTMSPYKIIAKQEYKSVKERRATEQSIIATAVSK